MMSGDNRFWFTEAELPYGKEGVRIQVAVDEVLYDEKSKWGHIQVFRTPFYGKMLVIDGIIQTSESDEFIYHEMMAILPSIQHGNPKKMLIIGGGDGGVMYQATRVKSLEKIVQVEIDDLVTKVSREFLPEVSKGAFDDPRVHLVYMDGADFSAATPEKFDIIVLDLTDPLPDSPAGKLFENDFLTNIKNILIPGGIVVMQCGSLIFQPEEVKQQITRFNQVFGSSRLHHAVIPGYQLTSFGILIGSVEPLKLLDRSVADERLSALSGETKYLTSDMYIASTTIPPYLAKQIL